MDETAGIVQASNSGAELLRSGAELLSMSPVVPSFSAPLDDLSPLMLGQSFNRRWPLKDFTEILLFEHFTHKLSCFVRITDNAQAINITNLLTGT